MDNNSDDPNLDKAKTAADMAVLQSQIGEYKKKLADLQSKVYTGRYKGVTIQMRGDYTVVDVSLDQAVYETASKSMMEQSILICLSNLHLAAVNESKTLTDELQKMLQNYQIPGLS
ncbi:MAG: YbaB/EbfC family nucleoid-associated protein [Bacilli bacterium]